MRIRFLKTSKENSDLEIVAVSLAVLGVLTGLMLPIVGVQLPACNFRRMTGIACPGCGGTRAWLLLSHMHVLEALEMNPLVAVLGIAGGLCALYSAVVLALGLPRIRLSFSSRVERRTFWIAMAVVALANWAYLIAVGR